MELQHRRAAQGRQAIGVENGAAAGRGAPHAHHQPCFVRQTCLTPTCNTLCAVQAVPASPGPVYYPNKFCAAYKPPVWTIQPRTPYHKGHLDLKEHAYLQTQVEFVNSGSVMPLAPRPPGNTYELAPGVPYKVSEFSEIGRGSNKARTDALNKFLGVELNPVPPRPKVDTPPYVLGELCEIGRGSHVDRIATIEAFLHRAATQRLPTPSRGKLGDPLAGVKLSDGLPPS